MFFLGWADTITSSRLRPRFIPSITCRSPPASWMESWLPLWQSRRLWLQPSILRGQRRESYPRRPCDMNKRYPDGQTLIELLVLLLPLFLVFVFGRFFFKYIGWWSVLPGVTLGFCSVALLFWILKRFLGPH